MGLCRKENKQFQIKCDDKLVFELLRYAPYNVSKVSPEIQGCDLIEGEWGTVGSVICWNYIHDGKKGAIKEILTSIDEEKKVMIFKVIDGNMMMAFKSFLITFQSTNSMATWTIEYEKVNENVPNPTSLLELLHKFIRDVDVNHHSIPRLYSNN